jgi:hypothetical protein
LVSYGAAVVGENAVKLNLLGRVRNTRLSHSNSLLPLFEAVINSIHSIEEQGSVELGEIKVFIERAKTPQIALAGTAPVEPITSFRVTDNGTGFTEANFDSFCTSDSQLKLVKGGKGVGRFLWLKAFDHAEIDSIYRSSNGEYWNRRFNLELSEEGIGNPYNAKLETTAPVKRETTVRLVNFKPDYQQWTPRSSQTVAKRMIEHCLEHFVLNQSPHITLHDEADSSILDLNEMYRSQVHSKLVTSRFTVKDKEFVLHNLRIDPDYQPQHRLYFCAHKRAVHQENLVGKVANLADTLLDDNLVPFVYAGYVSGNYLDDTVNTERTEFQMPKAQDVLQDISWDMLLTESAGQAAAYLSSYTESIKVEKDQRIRSYVQGKAPQYRHLLTHKKEALNIIAPDLSESDLDLELYKISQTYDSELRQKSATILSTLEAGREESPTFEEQYKQFTCEWNELGMSKLANHVAHRKATLSMLEASRKLTTAGKYQLESTIHNLICPLRRTSDDVTAAQMNLWVVDEKLAYHYYLASDVPFKQLKKEIMQIESDERADLVIFNSPAAFVNEGPPFSSVTLIEFKRPARDDYGDDDNPIIQIYSYVRQIKTGKAFDRGGTPINVPDHTPFYAYIVCDLTPNLVLQAENATLTQSPDSMGYFGYNPQLRTYVEIISFDKLIGDAKKRNAFLFDQLGIR